MNYSIRPARLSELDSLPAIEKAAGALFREVGMDFIAESTPVDLAFLRACAVHGSVLVAASEEAHPVGFLLVGALAEGAHIYELSVHPDHQRQGLGGKLLEAACHWAKSRAWKDITLSTFRDVPWNAPFYQRQGFRILTQDEWNPAMHILRHLEEQTGLPTKERCLMRKDLTHV